MIVAAAASRGEEHVDALGRGAQLVDLVRIGGSLKLGHVSAALLIARLQAGSRQHPLAKALVEYASCCAPSMPCAGSPTKPSVDVSAANSTGAKPSTTCAGSSSSPTAAPFATPTTTIRPPRHTATPSSSTPASCPPPDTSTTPSTLAGPRATRSTTRPSPTSARRTSKRSTPTGRSASTWPPSSNAPVDPYAAVSRSIARRFGAVTQETPFAGVVRSDEAHHQQSPRGPERGDVSPPPLLRRLRLPPRRRSGPGHWRV